ncbi:MAG: hypothetical protein ACJAUL_002411 [Paraglaciecola sp.]|jgi:hypothetical protein
MPRTSLEVADIFRYYGSQNKTTQQGHLSLNQLKVMSAITRCRSAQLGGHLLHCPQCNTQLIAYNSCRNRHCPKCQSSSAKRWLEARQTQLLPTEYYHVVFTLPAAISQLAFYNKSLMYHLLFKAASQTLLTIARDPKHLGAQIGMTMVLHTWGSAMTHHPHVHCIVPGGGISADKQQWQACKSGFFLPVRVLSRLFRRLFVDGLRQLFADKALLFYGDLIKLIKPKDFSDWCTQQQSREWVVYAKRPFAGPEAVLAYLSRYTHRVAIANSRLREINEKYVIFTYKDYRLKGHTKHKTMQLDTSEFIRRFMLHVLPCGFHRIRHYGLLASQTKLALARRLLNVPAPEVTATLEPVAEHTAPFQCRQCHQPMVIIAITLPTYLPRAPPT